MTSTIWTACDPNDCPGMWPEMTRDMLGGKTVISCARCTREILIILDKSKRNEPDILKKKSK